MMARYAAKTEVSAARSRAEIETIVEKYGAQQFLSGWSTDGRAVIGFSMNGRQVKFLLNMPDPKAKCFTHYKRNSYEYVRTESAAKSEYDQAVRQRWRALALVIKAKLEAVESGITVFEDEFLANIVMPNGMLVGEMARPAIAHAYETGTVTPLLPPPGGQP